MELNDKIRGAIVGMAYGDALGLGAEFMTREEVESYYPSGLRRFDQIIRDAHRTQWRRGEYSNDTTLTLLILECVMENGGFIPRKVCEKFQSWYKEEERDIAPFLRLYCTNKEWPENPIPTAHKLWHSSGLAEASNETLHRAVVTGLTCPKNSVNETSRKSVLMTHDDSRCVATMMILAQVIRNALDDKRDDIDRLMRLCNQIDNRTLPFLTRAWDGNIESIVVDDPATQSWTRKGMAAALWGYWHHDNAADTIHGVIDLGGDANSNASMAGVLAGLKYGFDEIPEEKEKIIGFEYLMDLSDRLADYIDKTLYAG